MSEKAVLRCPEGFSAVEIAAVANRTWVIEALHAFNPEASAARADGFGPFHLAALHGSLDALEALARLRPDELDRPCATGRTPLHFAALSGRERVFARLVELGADPNRPDAAGVSPEEYLLRDGLAMPLDPSRVSPTALDVDSARRLREWDGSPPRFALLRVTWYTRPADLKWAIWDDGTVLIDLTTDSRQPDLLVTRANPREFELMAADLDSMGLPSILGKFQTGLHGDALRLDIRSGPSLSSSTMSQAGEPRWLPECAGPEFTWFRSVWTGSLRLLGPLAGSQIHRLPHDPQHVSFRGYHPNNPSETPWMSAP